MPSAAFITSDWATHHDPPQPNGCAYYRCYLPSTLLADRGWDIGFGMPISTEELGIGLSHDGGGYFGFEINVLKLLMHESVPDLIRVMQRNGQRVVVDVDDFHYGIPQDNVAARITDPNRNATSNRMWYEMGIRAADTVIVSTDFLADFYADRVRDVRVVRNSLDTHRFTPVAQPENPTIGWVGATPWRSRDVELLADWLPRFVKQYGTPVHHSGHIPNDPKNFGARVGLGRVSTTLMTPMSTYPSLLTHFHIGLVPLTLSDFNESKSFLKGIEYAAAGIPFIASPTHEYHLLYEAGIGRLARTPDEWWDHAVELLNPDVRIAEAARQREIVRREFDISTMGEQWDTAIRG